MLVREFHGLLEPICVALTIPGKKSVVVLAPETILFLNTYSSSS